MRSSSSTVLTLAGVVLALAAASCRRDAASSASTTTSAATSATAGGRGSAEGGPRDGRPPIVIPPQCYTKTLDEHGRVHNPCFTCHTKGRAPNYLDDSDLQTSYDLARSERKNPYDNLFVDRSAAVARISDAEVLAWVRSSNYPPALPSGFAGYVPDAAFQFDEHGFDRRADGTYTGWRAYAYTPLPGSFFATNGSMDDALVRLPPAYRERIDGMSDASIYVANLAIVDALIRSADVAIDPTNENEVGVDLDGDGKLGVAKKVAFRKQPGAMSWAGRAAALQGEGKAPMAPGLFPVGTEFLHSVRYLDVTREVEGKEVSMAARMKELRYAKKTEWLTYADHMARAREEALEKKKNGNRARIVDGDERGVENGRGWRYQGFIENADGALRPQTYRESAACVGCHGGIGINVDSAISFQRRLPEAAFRRGWFHPSQHTLAGVAEPKRNDGRYEYTHYLEQNGAGDDLRANDEVIAKFFDAGGKLRVSELLRLHTDVTQLLQPSPSRALLLDKAYVVVVREQSFALGRVSIISPAQNVHVEVAENAPTGIREPIASR